MSSNLRNLMRNHRDVLSANKRLKMDCIFSNDRATLYEFDNQVRGTRASQTDSQVTRVLGEFDSVEDYYLSQSAVRVLDQVRCAREARNERVDELAYRSWRGTRSTTRSQPPHACRRTASRPTSSWRPHRRAVTSALGPAAARHDGCVDP